MKKREYLLIYLFLCAFYNTAYAQRNQVSTGACMVAEFKMIAHNVMNPTARELAAKNWLLTTGTNCNEAQLGIINASAPSWLGTSLSHEISIILDGLMERKIYGDSRKLIEHYTPAVRSFPPSIETQTNPKSPPPVIRPISSEGGQYMGGVGGFGNIVSNVIGGQKDGENNEPDNMRRDENKRSLFTNEQKKMVSNYFNQTRPDFACLSLRRDRNELGANNDEDLKKRLNDAALDSDSKKNIQVFLQKSEKCKPGCPEGMSPTGNTCSSTRRIPNLKIGSPINPILGKEIPTALRSLIGANPPGYKYLQIRDASPKEE